MNFLLVRNARQKIICLSNDHKNLMKTISKALESYHETNENVPEMDKIDIAEEKIEPFAKIDLVTSGSPSSDAGLKVGDLVAEFGSLNKKNFKNLTDIAKLVQNSQNRPIRVKVLRNGDKSVTLNLVPKKWSGQGLLGCKFNCI